MHYFIIASDSAIEAKVVLKSSICDNVTFSTAFYTIYTENQNNISNKAI